MKELPCLRRCGQIKIEHVGRLVTHEVDARK